MNPEGETPQDGNESSTAAQGNESSTAAPQKTVDELQKELESALAKLSAANAESAERRHRIAELEKEQQERKEATMSAAERLAAKEAEIAELKIEAGKLAEQGQAAQKVIREQLEATVTSLNVPSYVMEAIKLQPPADQLAFINAHRAEFAKPGPVSTDASKSGGVAGIKSPADLKGRDPDWINANWEAISAKLRK